MLEHSIPPLLSETEKSPYDIEIIVVDNNSSDNSKEFLEKDHPKVKVLNLDKNHGFSGGCNKGASIASGEILIFLNNDMIVCDNFLAPLITPFLNSRDIFGISSQIIMEETSKFKRREETGLTKGKWSFKDIKIYHEIPDDNGNGEDTPCLYAGGGSSAIRKDMFIELGGFDSLYEPFYFEDTDLSTRAWKRGWRILFAKDSMVIHKHRSTIGRDFNNDFINQTIKKNKILFILRHFEIPHLFSNLFKNIESVLFLNKNSDESINLLQSIKMVQQKHTALFKRILSEINVESKFTTAEILDISGNKFSYREKFLPKRSYDGKAPLDILMVTPYLPCRKNHAGAGRMFELIKSLSEKHNLDIVTFYDSDFEKNAIPELEKLCNLVVPVKRIPSKREDLFKLPVPKDIDDFYQAQMTQKVQEVINKRDYQIIHIEYQVMSQYLPETNRVCKMITIHEIGFSAILKRFRAESRIFKKIALFIEYIRKFVYEITHADKFDGVIVLTKDEKDKLKSYVNHKKIYVVNTGVDCKGLKSEKRKLRKIIDDPVLLYVGYYGHSPNVDAVNFFVNDIFPGIIKKYPNGKFIAAGNDPFRWIQHFHNGQNIICTGFVDDIKPIFNKADIFVVPLRLGGGIRGKILESFSMNLPVISSSVAALGLEVENGNHLIISDDKDDFTQKIIKMIEDEKLRKKLSVAGRQLVENQYDWSQKAKQLETIYKDLLNSRK